MTSFGDLVDEPSSKDLLTVVERCLGDEINARLLCSLEPERILGATAFEAIRLFGRAQAAKLLALRELRIRWLRNQVDRRRPLRQLSTLAAYLAARYWRQGQEVGGVVLLDQGGGLMSDHLLFVGTGVSLRAPRAEILAAVLQRHSTQFLFFHTHDTCTYPSQGDYKFHARLLRACERLDLELRDNLIITQRGAYRSLFRGKDPRLPPGFQIVERDLFGTSYYSEDLDTKRNWRPVTPGILDHVGVGD